MSFISQVFGSSGRHVCECTTLEAPAVVRKRKRKRKRKQKLAKVLFSGTAPPDSDFLLDLDSRSRLLP